MLKKLLISNFALIEEAEIDFQSGFTVITGETGSGKSILLGALALITGERADFSVIRDPNQKTIVEAYFSNLSKETIQLLEQNDLDISEEAPEEVIVRREISSKGKSRAFINDTPVQLTFLKEFGLQMVHVHSQHDTIDLKNKSFQLLMLDDLIDAGKERLEISRLYASLKSKKEKLNKLREALAYQKRNEEFNRFQLEEILALKLESTDYTAIELALKRNQQFESIKSGFEAVVATIEDEEGVNDKIVRLSKLLNLDDEIIQEISERLNQVRIELDDIAAIASDQLLDLEYNPNEIEQQITQLDNFNRILAKHNKSNQSDLLTVQVELENSLKIGQDNEEELSLLEKDILNESNNLSQKAEQLSVKREKNAPLIAKKLISLLGELKLENSKLEFSFNKKEISENGQDEVELLFTPNKGMQPKSIEKTASGGELSRVMLVLQSLLSQKRKLPTVIFDEIDTGVSGEVAERIGLLLREMGKRMQLFAVTHLPQVASKGNSHIKVLKNMDFEKTSTIFVPLSSEERVEEIAKLMSGKEINEAALSNAKNLLNQQI